MLFLVQKTSDYSIKQYVIEDSQPAIESINQQLLSASPVESGFSLESIACFILPISTLVIHLTHTNCKVMQDYVEFLIDEKCGVSAIRINDFFYFVEIK